MAEWKGLPVVFCGGSNPPFPYQTNLHMDTLNYNKLFEQIYEENGPKLRIKLKQGLRKSVADVRLDSWEDARGGFPIHLRQQNPRFEADYAYYAEIPVDFGSENKAVSFDILLNFFKRKGLVEGNTKFAELLSFIVKWYNYPLELLVGDIQDILEGAYTNQGKEQEWRTMESDQAFWDRMTSKFDPDFTGAPYIDETDISFIKEYLCERCNFQFVVELYYEIEGYTSGTSASWDGHDFGSYDPGSGSEFEGSEVVSFYLAEPDYCVDDDLDEQGNGDYCFCLGERSDVQSLFDKDSMSAIDELVEDAIEGFQTRYDENYRDEDDRW